MSKKVKHIFYFILLLIFKVGVSQTDIDETISDSAEVAHLKYDTSYIVSYAEVFTPRLIVTNKKNEFVITEQNSDAGIKYQPNSPLNLGFGVTYKWFGINLAFNFPFINNDDEIYGKTRRLDLQSNIFGRKFALGLFFQYYKGYYIANPNLIDPGWQPGNPFPVRGDITSAAIGASGFYIFNHRKFSYRAAFNFNERQKKSAGSFTAGGGILNYRLSSDSGMVPSEIFPDSIEAINFDLVRIGSTYILGGYTHTFVIRHWYFNIGLGLGVGISTTRVNLTTGVKLENNSRLSVVSDFRGSIGYNSDVFYVGLSWASGAFAINSSKDVLITYSLSKINFYVGYRFYKFFH